MCRKVPVVLFLTFLLSLNAYGRMADRDINQLVEFILDQEKDAHEDFQLAVNETVRLAVDGLLDRLKCVQEGLSHLQCVQCLRPEAVLSMLGPASRPRITNHLDLEHLSVILLNHALNFRTSCRDVPKNTRKIACNSYPSCKNQLRQRLPFGSSGGSSSGFLEDIENVLREIKAFYEPLPGKKCFSAENVLAELLAREKKSRPEDKAHLEQLATQLMAHILNGECIDVGEAVTDFIEDLFLHYGDRCNRVLTQPGFEKLLNDLKTQDHDEHKDHGMPENSCSQTLAKKEYEKNRKSTIEPILTMTEVGGLPKELLEQNAYSMKEFNRRTTRGAVYSIVSKHEHKSLASECLTANSLLRRFSLTPSQTITPIQFLQLCPALVQQAVSGVCIYGVNSSVSVELAKPTTMEIYGWSTLAVFIISLSSLCGIFILPILAKSSYKYVMMGFIGLSFGTMAGDALLHLIPQALGLHSHEESENETEEEDEHFGVSFATIPQYLWLQLGILTTIYILYLFEAVANVVSSFRHEEGSHGHSHVPDKLPEALSMKNFDKKNKNKQDTRGVSNSHTHVEVQDEPVKFQPVVKSTKAFCGLTTMAFVIIIGDTFHNFGDGLAIGASFAPGLRGGLSTSLAVFCHELPHEFGDFVVLLSTGLPFGKALLMNFISALFSFGGLYIGILLGENLTARTWILAVTAGIFLYVALTEMLPELKSNNDGNPWIMFLVKNFGVLVGVSIMILIAIYEDHFHF